MPKWIDRAISNLKAMTKDGGTRVLHAKIRVKNGTIESYSHQIENPKVLSKIMGSPEDPLGMVTETFTETFAAAYGKRRQGALCGSPGLSQGLAAAIKANKSESKPGKKPSRRVSRKAKPV